MSPAPNTGSSPPQTTTQAVHFPSPLPELPESEPTQGELRRTIPNPLVKQEMEHDPLPHRERAISAETERPPSAQQTRKEEEEIPSHDQELKGMGDGEDTNNIEEDPAGEIKPLDWQDLEHRYHQAMEGCQKNEQELQAEFAKLMKFFQAWAEVGHKQETDRTFSRLRTRMAHVQHSEVQLERTRDHYIKVVQAFESALNLLRNMGG